MSPLRCMPLALVFAVLGCHRSGPAAKTGTPAGGCAMPVEVRYRDEWLTDPNDRRYAHARITSLAHDFLEHYGLCELPYRLVFTLDAAQPSPEDAKEYRMPVAYRSALHLLVQSSAGGALGETATPVVFTAYEPVQRFSLLAFELDGSALVSPVTMLTRQFVCGTDGRGRWVRPGGYGEAPKPLTSPETSCSFPFSQR